MRRPKFIAEQARHARGMLGRFVAHIMAGETWAHNLRAIEALEVQPADHVLDIGCGPGRSLSHLSALAAHGHIVGVDPSETMASIARDRNRSHGARVRTVVASAASLPFEDASFDKALCVHVVYFWNDLPAAFQEIARVMKPGGRLSLLFRTDADEAAVRAFPAEVYRFPAPRDVVAPLEAAGFAVVRIEQAGPAARPPPALIVAARRRD